jgi:hypothetical protein
VFDATTEISDQSTKTRYNPLEDRKHIVDDHDILIQYVAGTRAL